MQYSYIHKRHTTGIVHSTSWKSVHSCRTKWWRRMSNKKEAHLSTNCTRPTAGSWLWLWCGEWWREWWGSGSNQAVVAGLWSPEEWWWQPSVPRWLVWPGGRAVAGWQPPTSHLLVDQWAVICEATCGRWIWISADLSHDIWPVHDHH